MAAPETSADTPEMSSVPSLTAGSGVSMHGGMPMYTPPQTPGYVSATPVMHASTTTGAGVKRENDNAEDASRDKRRRIAPTLISEQ
jgi:chromatin assembly factor 1 subunit B